MPYANWDDSAEELDDREYPDVGDWDDDTSETVVCPECGAEVFEDADQCPACGMFIIEDTQFWSGKSNFWIALGILGIMAVAVALIFGL